MSGHRIRQPIIVRNFPNRRNANGRDAIAVMFGLTFATVLTLVIVPTLTATVYRVPSPPGPSRAS